MAIGAYEYGTAIARHQQPDTNALVFNPMETAGVEDDGNLLGLETADLEASLDTLNAMTHEVAQFVECMSSPQVTIQYRICQQLTECLLKLVSSYTMTWWPDVDARWAPQQPSCGGYLAPLAATVRLCVWPAWLRRSCHAPTCALQVNTCVMVACSFPSNKHVFERRPLEHRW